MNELEIVKQDIAEVKTNNKKLENLMYKLAQGTGFCNEVLCELTSGITNIVSSEVKNQVKEELVTVKEEIKGNIIETVTENINNTVDEKIAERGLNRQEINKLTQARQSKFKQLLGNSNSDKYTLFIRFYQSQFKKEYSKEFECNAYGDVNAKRFDEAVAFTNNFTISQKYHEWCENTLHKNYADNEIESNKKFNAYKRYYGLVR